MILRSLMTSFSFGSVAIFDHHAKRNLIPIYSLLFLNRVYSSGTLIKRFNIECNILMSISTVYFVKKVYIKSFIEL